jgi:hypothetical protein
VLLGLFSASVWGFEDLLTKVSREHHREEEDVTLTPNQELYVKPSQIPYTREEWDDLLNELSRHRGAIYQEYPIFFERFREEARNRAVLIVQDVQPAAELMKKAFGDFGFSVMVYVVPSLDLNHTLIDCAKRADLVVWDAKPSDAGPISQRFIEKSQKYGSSYMRVLAASAITRRPDVLKKTFESWLSDYPQTFADAFFWHLFKAAAGIPKAKAFAASKADNR